MLLEHGETYQVIQSSGKGLSQHNALTWEVSGNSFIYLSKLTEESKYTEEVINNWIYNMNPEQREEFSNAVFQFIKLSGESVPNLFSGKAKISRMLSAGLSMDKKLREHLFSQLKTLRSSLKAAKVKHRNSLRYKTI